jgi:hypothetical protein
MTHPRKTLLGLSALVLSVALVGCKQTTSTPTNTNAAEENTNMSATVNVNDSATLKVPITVPLQPQNDSDIRGTVTITEAAGKARLTIQYNNGLKDTPQPAHIHTGSCAQLGGVKYPLTSAVNGASVTTLNISVAQLLKEKPWAINVHKSVAEADTYVACGDQLLSNVGN